MKRVRLITWNCAGKFRDKYQLLQSLNPDICVVQECEVPKASRHEGYASFSANSLWIGERAYKGLGVFARKGIRLTRLDWETHGLRHFLPVRIDDSWDLLAVWAGKPYIREYYIFHSVHKDKINENTVILGDFNSNRRWDKDGKICSHSAVVDMMSAAGLVSAWHYIKEEPQGGESVPTFYMHRDQEKPYHIDYTFVSPSRVLNCYIDDSEAFACSDHRPLIVDIRG